MTHADAFIRVRFTKSPKEDRFWDFHLANPRIWELFESGALRAIAAGRTKLSGWLVMNGIRWMEEVEGGRPFKVANDHIAFYTRLFMRLYPEHRRFFKIKAMKRE